MSVTQNAINNLLATTALTGFIQAANFPALTGDVTTVAGTLATIISNSAVTYAKIQNESATTLLGNPTGAPAAPSEITLGTGLSFSGSVLNATSVYSSIPVTTVAGTTQTMVGDNAYTANNAALVTLTLPTTIPLGQEIQVMGLGTGGWLIAQNAGQLIHFGNKDTTTGVTGSIASIHQYDTLRIKCVVANTTFTVIASQGNFTVS